MEIWGGVECTVNRIDATYRDQQHLSGHHDRPDDLQRIADLGIRTLRFPILWERCCAKVGGSCDFAWADTRMALLDKLGIRPIIGLLHHGSGPRGTDLAAPDFVECFAAFAGAVAARYPHVAMWTPVNEPLTTARFAALYGHWYPHARDRALFWQALLNQIEGTGAAMAAIRRHNPRALLLQTEDIGETYATPGDGETASVAAYYNRRRWLGFDLLEGRVDPRHPFWNEVEAMGCGDRMVALAAAPTPPDLIGLNHYVTSDRFLDARNHLYRAPSPRGFHDVEAVRATAAPPPGLRDAIDKTWRRYGRPLAITECHLACTREEQMRWLAEGWQTALDARADGVDIRAVTSWALFGSYDWDSLLTEQRDTYETGAFDVRDALPRPTGIARVVSAIARDGRVPAEPALEGAGWWRRDDRLTVPPVDLPMPSATAARPARDPRPILITGATGTLGQALARACAARDLAYVLTARRDLDICDAHNVAAVVEHWQPWAIINAAGWVRVDDAEDAPEECLRANRDAAANLASAADAAGVPFVTFSSDLVFDGRRDGAYSESDAPCPLNVYGRSKAEAEDRVLAACRTALVVRTAAFFSPHDDHNFAVHVERALRSGTPVTAAGGFMVTPSYVPDLVDATLDLMIDGVTGIRHLSSGTALDWYGWAREIATRFDFDDRLIACATSHETLGWRARRPRNAALGSVHRPIMPSFEAALARHVTIRGGGGATARAAA